MQVIRWNWLPSLFITVPAGSSATSLHSLLQQYSQVPLQRALAHRRHRIRAIANSRTSPSSGLLFPSSHTQFTILYHYIPFDNSPRAPNIHHPRHGKFTFRPIPRRTPSCRSLINRCRCGASNPVGLQWLDTDFNRCVFDARLLSPSVSTSRCASRFFFCAPPARRSRRRSCSCSTIVWLASRYFD